MTQYPCYLGHTPVPLPQLLQLTVGEEQLHPLLQVVITQLYKPCTRLVTLKLEVIKDFHW